MRAAEDVYFGGNNPDPLDLAEAILRSVGLHNMTMDEAARMASLVMGYFEPERRVDASAILSAEGRDVFYMLEDAGILAYEPTEQGVVAVSPSAWRGCWTCCFKTTRRTDSSYPFGASASRQGSGHITYRVL